MSEPRFSCPGSAPDLAIYRVFHLNAEGRVVSSEVLSARSDDEAMSKALMMANGHGIDLWEGNRFLASYPPVSAP